jgi:hypothetical protein
MSIDIDNQYVVELAAVGFLARMREKLRRVELID